MKYWIPTHFHKWESCIRWLTKGINLVSKCWRWKKVVFPRKADFKLNSPDGHCSKCLWSLSEIYAHIAFWCPHSHIQYEWISRDNSDRDTAHTWVHTNSHTSIMCNQTQRACEKTKSTKRSLRVILNEAALTRVLFSGCDSLVLVHFGIHRLNRVFVYFFLLSNSFRSCDRTNLYVHTVSWCFSVNGLWTLIFEDCVYAIGAGIQNIAAFRLLLSTPCSVFFWRKQRNLHPTALNIYVRAMRGKQLVELYHQTQSPFCQTYIHH